MNPLDSNEKDNCGRRVTILVGRESQDLSSHPASIAPMELQNHGFLPRLDCEPMELALVLPIVRLGVTPWVVEMLGLQKLSEDSASRT